MKIEQVIVRDYAYHAAGRVWCVPKLALDRLPDGATALPLSEIQRVHRGIANQICGERAGLTPVEFEFLCDITSSTYAEVAREVGISPSTLTKWRERGGPMERLRSLYLKKWFWFRLFGAELGDQAVNLRLVQDDADVLEYVSAQAVAQEFADAFEEKVA